MIKRSCFTWEDLKLLVVGFKEKDALLINWSIFDDIQCDSNLWEIFEMSDKEEWEFNGYLGELRGIPVYMDKCLPTSITTCGQIFLEKESIVLDWINYTRKINVDPIFEYYTLIGSNSNF